MSYQEDRIWSDKFIPRIKDIVGPCLLSPAPFEQDAKEASDLVILRARDMTIACRVRRFGFLPSFDNQFTLRAARLNGTKTEMEKIVEGFGDWMFYGHSNQAEDDFEKWWLIDLAAWRAHMIRDNCRNGEKRLRWGVIDNHDLETRFAWFDIESFRGIPALLINRSYTVECPF